MGKYDKIKEEIKKEYETTTKSLKFLAKEYNVPYDTVWTWSKKFNWVPFETKLPNNPNKISQELVDKAKDLFENTSMNLKEISDKINIPRNTIQTWKQKFNWIKKEEYVDEYKHNISKNFERSNINDDIVQIIKKLYETTNLTVVQIADIVNLTTEQVWVRINKFKFQRSESLKHESQSNKIKQIISNMTQEQRQQQKQKISEANKQVWNNRSEEDKQRIINNRIQTMNNKTEEELQNIREKISKSVTSKINEINYKRILNMKKAKSLTGKYFDSNYEAKIYDLCMKNNTNITIETQVPVGFINNNGQSIIDFKINNEYYECKGSHLLEDVYKNSKLKDKLDLYSNKYITVITDYTGINILNQYNEQIYFNKPINYINIDSKEDVICTMLDFNKELYYNVITNFCKRLNLDYHIDKENNLICIEELRFYLLDEDEIKLNELFLRDTKSIVITNKLNANIIPKPNGYGSNGLKYLKKCPNPLIGVDIELFKDPEIPYRDDRPKCFYDVRVNGKLSVSEAWKDEALRWKMIKNRIYYSGGFIDNKQVLNAMNVTRTCKQPSWFSKQYAKDLIQKYITTNTIFDSFAGWGARCDACKELKLNYYGWDLNKELVDWHHEKGRLIDTGCGIEYGDANNVKIDMDNCSVFICPPYTDFEKYFDEQDIETTQCQWLEIVMKNIPNAKEYLMVCKVVDEGWEKYIVEEKVNKSHLGINKEYVILIRNRLIFNN